MGLLSLALPALVLLQAQPTFYSAWEDARDAERRGHFTQALAAYQRAAELRPRSAAQVIIYGNNLLKGYFPYTRIARCCIELSQWGAADKALAQAEREGEPAAEVKTLEARLRESRPREAVPPPPVPQRAVVPAPAPVPQPSPAAIAPSQPEAASNTPLPPPQKAPAPVERRLPAAPRQDPQPLAPAPSRPEAASPAASKKPLLPWTLAGAGLALAAGLALGRRKKSTGAEPETVGPYRLERLLGRGGFASTYLARHKGGGEPVALKRLHAFRQDDPEFLRRFRQEASLGSLLDHPNIVRLLDQDPQDETPWLVMEYVEGRRFDAVLKDAGILPLPLAVDLARQVASAMAYAHAKGVIHRDLKPSNIMIVGSKAKVMDFGIARIMDSETLTTTYAFLGTPLYAAPELQTKTTVGPAADRYSFGILLFEMIAGRPPFTGETPFQIMDQHRSAPLPDLAALRPETPEALVDLVKNLTHKDPAQRPEDSVILAVLEAL